MTTHLVAAGVMLRRTITDAERQQAKALYASGMFIKNIAKTLRRNPATIAKLVHSDGVALGPARL